MPPDFQLGKRADDSSEFCLPYIRRPEGVVIIGQNGMGKSSLIYRMVERDLMDNVGAIVIDPKGNLADRLQDVRPEKTILIEVKEDHPFGINPYEIIGSRTVRNIDRTVNNVVNLFRKVFGDHEFHPNIEMIVRVTARMIACNDLTMVEVPYIFGSKTFRKELIQNVKSIQVQHFWDHWDSLPAIEKSRLVQPLIARLNAFLDQEWLYRVLSQRKTTIPWDKVFKQGYTILIKLPREDEELTNFLGAVFVSLLTQAVWRQNEVPERERRRVHLYIDEYSAFAGSAATSMLYKQARDLEISTTAAMQVLSDIKDIAHREALMQAGTLLFFQLTGNDGEAVVNNLTIPPEEPKIDPRQFTLIEDLVRHIKTYGHDNPDVVDFVDHSLFENSDIDYIWRGIIKQGKSFSTSSEAMSKYIDMTYKYMGHRAPTIFFFISVDDKEYGHLSASSSYRLRHKDNEFKMKYYSLCHDYVRKLNSFVEKFIKVQGDVQVENDLKKVIKESYYHVLPITYPEGQKNPYEIPPDKLYEIIEQKINNLKAQFTKLIKCGIILSENPKNLYVPTGAIDIEQLGKQVKSFADRKGELANSLTHLPHYTTYAQTHGDDGVPREGIVRLTEPGYFLWTIDGLEMVYINSEDCYSRWEDIEPEIEQRQAGILTTLQRTPPKKQTPQEPDTQPLMTRSEIYYPE